MRATAIIGILLLVSACGDDADAREIHDSLRQTWRTVEDWTTESWDDFVGEAEVRVDGLESRFEELQVLAQERGESLPEEAREAVKAARERLDSLSETASESFESASEETRKAIDEASRRISHAWDELSGSSSDREDSDSVERV